MFTSGKERTHPKSYADLKQRNYTLYSTSFSDSGGIIPDGYEKFFISENDKYFLIKLLT